MKLDLNEFRRQIGWQNVVTEVRDADTERPYGVIRVLPRSQDLPAIEIWGTSDLDSYGEVWFVGWDACYDEDGAVELVAGLVAGEMTILQELGPDDKVMSLSPLAAEKSPRELHDKAVKWRKIYFDREAETLNIDLSQFLRVPYGWICLEDAKAVYDEDPSAFDFWQLPDAEREALKEKFLSMTTMSPDEG